MASLCLFYSATKIKHITHSPRYISQRSPFPDNGTFENENREKQVLNIGGDGNFHSPIPVLCVSTESEPISWVLGYDSWQDNRLPSTRKRRNSGAGLSSTRATGHQSGATHSQISPQFTGWLPGTDMGARIKIQGTEKYFRQMFGESVEKGPLGIVCRFHL